MTADERGAPSIANVVFDLDAAALAGAGGRAEVYRRMLKSAHKTLCLLIAAADKAAAAERLPPKRRG